MKVPSICASCGKLSSFKLMECANGINAYTNYL